MPPSYVNAGLRLLGEQGWLRGRERVIRLFVDPDHQQPVPFETTFYGLPYVGRMDNFIDWHVRYFGAFAPQELQLLGEIGDGLRQRGGEVNFFDIGANTGQHSLYMSQHADRVFCFEPFEVVRNEMLRKFRHAGVDRAAVFPVALGNRNETAQFHPPTGCNQGTGTLSDLLPDNASGESIPVEVVRGDDFFAAQQLPRISVMKMDVEGFELQALEGLRETLWRDRPPMLMEIQHLPTDAENARKLERIHELLYPGHLIFDVRAVRRQYRLLPFTGTREEVLILPPELRGIVRGTAG